MRRAIAPNGTVFREFLTVGHATVEEAASALLVRLMEDPARSRPVAHSARTVIQRDSHIREILIFSIRKHVGPATRGERDG